MSKVVIKSGLPGTTRVIIDGKELTRCKGVEFNVSVGTVPTVKLEFEPDELEIDMELAEVSVKDTNDCGMKRELGVLLIDGKEIGRIVLDFIKEHQKKINRTVR